MMSVERESRTWRRGVIGSVKWEVMHAYRENTLLCETRIIDMIAVVILHKPTYS